MQLLMYFTSFPTSQNLMCWYETLNKSSALWNAHYGLFSQTYNCNFVLFITRQCAEFTQQTLLASLKSRIQNVSFYSTWDRDWKMKIHSSRASTMAAQTFFITILKTNSEWSATKNVFSIVMCFKHSSHGIVNPLALKSQLPSLQTNELQLRQNKQSSLILWLELNSERRKRKILQLFCSSNFPGRMLHILRLCHLRRRSFRNICESRRKLSIWDPL